MSFDNTFTGHSYFLILRYRKNTIMESTPEQSNSDKQEASAPAPKEKKPLTDKQKANFESMRRKREEKLKLKREEKELAKQAAKEARQQKKREMQQLWEKHNRESIEESESSDEEMYINLDVGDLADRLVEKLAVRNHLPQPVERNVPTKPKATLTFL